MLEAVVETKGLAKSFDGVPALTGLDLTVLPGEMFGLVGPDGAGKTTVIRLLCGILSPDSGTISVLGRDMQRERETIKNEIGYLSQRFSLYGDLTVDENIQFFAELHGVRDYARRREELLDFTRLSAFRRRLADRLSGGMKQKLALACTLIHEPRLVLLDEPTTGVDPVSRRDFWSVLAGLVRRRVTVILTTPYMDEAERCSRVGLLAGGKLAAVDTPDNLKRGMKETVLEINTEDNRRAYYVLRDSPDTKSVQLFGDRLNAVVADPAAAGRIERVLANSGLKEVGLKKISPSLENVFLSAAESELAEAKK